LDRVPVALKTDVQHVLDKVDLDDDQRKIRENIINNID